MAEARIFENLKADHDRHRKMLAQLSETEPGSEERETQFEALRKELQAHAAAEEESLYATMLADPDLRDEARHSVSEHKEIDDFLAELVKTDPGSSEWLETFKKMRHRYLHHIEEEEDEMFPQASEALSERTEERLARVFEERKPEELAIAEEDKPGDERD